MCPLVVDYDDSYSECMTTKNLFYLISKTSTFLVKTGKLNAVCITDTFLVQLFASQWTIMWSVEMHFSLKVLSNGLRYNYFTFVQQWPLWPQVTTG